VDQAPGTRSTTTNVGLLLLLIAGVLFLIGAFVTAATVTIQGQSQTATLWDGWEGKASLILGIVLLATGVGIWAMRERVNRRAVGALIAVVGLAATIFALVKILTVESEAVNAACAAAAAQQGVPVAAAKQAVQRLFDSGIASVSTGLGLYLVIIAGILTIASGVVLAMTRSAERHPDRAIAPSQPM
jgi:hypothetical protein